MNIIEIKQNLNYQISLEEYIRFRANSGVQSIISQSIALFKSLVTDSSFFRFFQDEPEKMFSQQDLKLQACVECQKLRSIIRYDWITSCLILAPFESHWQGGESSMAVTGPTPPKLVEDETNRSKLYNLLAMLMGHLLRQHFLFLALDQLCNLLESHRLSPPTKGVDLVNKLVIHVQLVDGSSSGNIELIDCSQPDKELKETLCFLVDELASICLKLPRLETQLASQSLDYLVVNKNSYIKVLHEGDSILDDVKSYLEHLVDCSFYSREQTWWIDPEYKQIIEFLNSLRINDAPGQLISGKESAEIRLKQLQSSCQQLDLINQQEMKLSCQLKRYYDYGIVLLDYEPLRESLIQCARKERLIMTRLVLDDFLKLLYRLQMQFDEAEIGVDLESAIDDYLGERRQQQHQQQQLILSDSESLDQEDLPDYQSESSSKIEANQQTVFEDEDEDEAFMNVLSGRGANANANQQFMALSASSSILNSMNEQRVVPVVECQLLLSKYNSMKNLLTKELEPLKEDMQVAFKGLIFLSEYVNEEQLEPSHSDLIMELATRAREFTPILSQSLDRLDCAQSRLLHSNQTRSIALNKLVVEFHLLMSDMSGRKLQQGDFGQVRQLDSIQETTDWANQLESRFQFLLKQNSLLAKESHLIRECRISLKQIKPSYLEDKDEHYVEDSKCRAEILERWQQPVRWIASFWRLVECYETQQVKWLNSDIKRIDFNQLKSIFQLYKQRWLNLHEQFNDQLKDIEPLYRAALEKNLDEMKNRLEQFEELRLPLFKFLTNRYLTEAHWSKLSELLSEERRGISSGLLIIQPQACTTLAQFLELNLDKYIDQLKAMNQQAIMEQELSTFLEVEANRTRELRYKNAHLNALAITRAWFEGWTDQELIVAASRYIELKFSNSSHGEIDFEGKNECYKFARYLVDIHALVKRYVGLRYTLNLDQLLVSSSINPRKLTNLESLARGKIIMKTCDLLVSPSLVTPALFVEFLKLATQSWTKSRRRLSREIEQVELSLSAITRHLSDIQSLVSSVNELHSTDLRRASMDSERILIHLEREMANMELEREILATKEALALERQREALATRDECIRQITERAIPAIRAAAKALDCLDGRSLRALRSLRPSPPEPIRLVLEAVCLLRWSCVQQQTASDSDRSSMKPERKFDPLKGKIIEDYWPAASRMLNGTHSSKFIADLRQVDKHQIPVAVMRLIRRRYLSSSKFKLSQVGRVSRECALLAKWLIAVDVFDRVINVVRPNYRRYMNADKHLSELLAEVNNRRRQIEMICGELRELEDSFENKISHKMSLVDSLDQCKRQLKQVESTRTELLRKRQTCMTKLEHLKHNQTLLMDKCVLRAARYVYVDAMQFEDRKPMTGLLKRQTLAAGGID